MLSTRVSICLDDGRARPVDVWRVELEPAPGRLAAWAAVLSEEELTRARAFRFERDYRRFVVSHGAVRQVLAGYTGGGAGELEFAGGSGEKPRLATETPYRFNLAHSEEIAMIAVSADAEVGVDVERVRDLDWPRLAGRYFTAREVSSLEALPPADRCRGFFRIWTCKEALLKAVGVGLAAPLADVEVELEADRPVRLCPSAGVHPKLALAEIDAGPGYVAALAVEA